MNNTMQWKAPLSIGCILLGMLITLQFKTQKTEGFPLTNFRSNELVRMVKDLESERRRLMEELKDVRVQLQRFEEAAKEEKGMSQILSQELEKRKMEAGMVSVEGPGLVVVLRDSTKQPVSGEDNYFYIIHDVDLHQLVTELWAAGAEAISINGERLVANTAIRCVGPTVLVNTVRLAPPYIVHVIGEPVILEASLKMQGGFLNVMAASIRQGVTVEIVRKPLVSVPAFQGTTSFKYARPVVPGKTNR